jgi:Dyp-type peroxidase family
MTYPGPPPPPPPSPPPVEELPLRNGEDAKEIQGNILAGFNKDHQFFVFLQFPDGGSGRAWLAELLPKVATTKQVATFEAFAAGAHARAEAVGDRGEEAPDRWVVGRPDQHVHAVVTVAADDADDLREELARVRQMAFKHRLVIRFEQRGDTLPGARRGHEHFGFKDGISQPGVRGFHKPDPQRPDEREGHPGTDLVEPGEFVLGHPREATSPQQNVPPWMRNGSFQVFRRLRQDVPAWWAQFGQRARELGEGAGSMSADLLAAKVVGRWRSGTPLAKAPERDNRSARDRSDDNDFDYADDPQGHKTPQFAHIRKVYPRDDRFQDESRRILRRGIPFGRAFDPAAGRGHGVDAERGLLFNVFQASIEQQFEFLQQSWASDAGFPEQDTGPDGVIGNDPAAVRLRRADLPDSHLDFRRFVKTTGAVYAFAPSCSALRSLAGL